VKHIVKRVVGQTLVSSGSIITVNVSFLVPCARLSPD